MSEGGPSLSDDVAITALVISLFALVVGLSQFAQAILGTAEGYRRCASSVIGPWSKLRNRVFRWSEFRFETKYVIPLITLVLPHEGIFRKRPGQDQSEQVGGDDVYILDLYCETQQQGGRSLHERLLQRHPIGDILRASLHLPELKRHDSVSRPHAAQRASIDSDHLPADTLVLADSVEKGIQAKNVFQSMLPGATKRRGPRNSLPVTWIRLLRDLHMLYLSYYRGSLRCADDGVLEMVREHLAGEALSSDWKMRNMMRTRVAIIPIEETWDFMPPDVARPLAQSTVGVILVLAIRLGMQWRTLKRASSQLYADGNGYSLSSTDVKGLGIVLKFSVFGDSEHKSAIIPSRAVDKLMCGIVPGDPELVDDRFELIDRDRKLIHLWQPEGIYSRLGLDEASSKKLQSQNRWTTHNEIVTLLCCFLSLPGSHANGFYFPGWRSRQYSIFHFFEPRLALKITVTKALEQRPGSVGLKEAKRILEILSSEYTYQFYDSYVKPGIGSTASTFTGSEYGICQTISEYFKKHEYHKRNGTDKTWYMQLVAAHARLSAWANEDFDPSQPLSQVEILKKRQKLLEDNDIETTYFAEHLYNQTERYIALVDHEQHGVVQYMQERSFSGTEDEIVGAWWMLMVRGIVWDMTCRCLPYPGEPVPSSYFYDETSVWFT